MDWMKIGSALLLGAMIIFIFPKAKMMLKHSPKASAGDWQAVLLPLVVLIGFIVLLVMSV